MRQILTAPQCLRLALSLTLACGTAALAPDVALGASQSCVAPPSGMTAWWTLDETSGTTAGDSVGKATATYTGSPLPVQTPGLIAGALKFDGSSDYLEAADSSLWAFGTSDFTIELWVNFNSTPVGSVGQPADIFIGNDEGPNNLNKWFFALGGGYLEFHVNSPTLGPHFFPQVPFSPKLNQWYHLALTRSGSVYTIYVNGLAGGSAMFTSPIPTPNAPLTIGQAEGAGYVKGLLDEITIYNRALSQSELQAIANAAGAGKCKSGATASPVITSTTLPGGTVGVPYSQKLVATGGVPPYTNWVVGSGALPMGLALDASFGTISGTPTSANGSPYNFSVTLRDADGNVSSPQSFSINVANTSDPGATSTLVLVNGTIDGQSVSPGNAAVTVSPGAAITGSFTVSINSSWPGTDVMAMGVTPTWGQPSSSFTDLGGFGSPVSGIHRTIPLNLTAPVTAGTYYVIAAFRAEYTAGEVMSCTNWQVGSLNWTTGYAIADWSASTIDTANSAGTVLASYQFPGGNQPQYVPATAITIVVSIQQAPSIAILTPSSLPDAAVGASYSEGLAATGGLTPYKGWAVASGSQLPPGLTLTPGVVSDTAVLSGTPTSSGTFTFTLQVTDHANTVATRQFTLKVTDSSNTLSASGIVNAASFLGGKVSPGEIVTIFSSFPGPATLTVLQLDSQGHVSTSLSGMQVRFDGLPAPMIYASAGQVSAVVPYEVSGQSSTQVQISYQGQLSNAVAMPVAAAIPGIFTANSSGTGQGAILNQDGTVNSLSNPAAVGTVVLVYATGEGQTTPGGVDGILNAGALPLPLAQPVTATIGGLPATVQYAGGVSGLIAGVLQANVVIPAGVTPGGSVPVALNIGGAVSQANVTVAIAPSTTN